LLPTRIKDNPPSLHLHPPAKAEAIGGWSALEVIVHANELPRRFVKVAAVAPSTSDKKRTRSRAHGQSARNPLCRRASIEAVEAANWGGLTNTKTDDRKRLDPLGTCTSRSREQIRHELRSYLFGIPIDNL
jgi:hypothetical protein